MTAGFLISAPASGTGKTTVTLGLLSAFRARGLSVQPFKNGPDYIDPAFHQAAAGRMSFNLDCWAMSGAQIGGLVGASQGADLALTEGSMGLFDGVAGGRAGSGATSDLAALTGWPVILVLDASGQAQSIGAIALGFSQFRAGVKIAGVIANRVASKRHELMIREGLAEAGIACFGCLPRRKDIVLPERHLGLVQAQETSELDTILAQMAGFVEEHLDLDAILKSAQPTQVAGQHKITPTAQRIALAQDAAFSFIYPHLLQGWRAAGAEILPFSPLRDEAPDPSADLCWLSGGYPELHAGALASAHNFRRSLQNFAQTRPVHGECGGYMAMGAGLIDAQGARHEMAGLLGLVTSYQTRKLHLGYRIATLNAPALGLGKGAVARGHEFHYSTIIDQPDPPLAAVLDARGDAVAETGSIRHYPSGGSATGSYFHFISEA